MGLVVKNFVLGPIENNTYLIFDSDALDAVLIDPSAPSREIIAFLSENNLNLSQIWLTHAHFDHIGGVRWFKNQTQKSIRTMIHTDALPLWEKRGGADDFGFDFDPGPPPEMRIAENDRLTVGRSQFTVLHTPGHTPGHVTFYSRVESLAFCGDLIFFHGVGRTDLEGGDHKALAASITAKIFSLPDETVLYPGHGKATTVKEEKANNPFV